MTVHHDQLKVDFPSSAVTSFARSAALQSLITKTDREKSVGTIASASVAAPAKNATRRILSWFVMGLPC
jgi:hypothetical protein